MNGLPSSLTLFLLAMFSIGVGIFYSVAMRRGSRSAFICWSLCAVGVMALVWLSGLMQVPAMVAIYAGFLPPTLLGGGMGGIIVAVIRQGQER